MSSGGLRILQVNTSDGPGGAAMVAGNLHRSYRNSGLNACLAVGRKSSDDHSVVTIANLAARSWHSRSLSRLEESLRSCNTDGLVRRFLRMAAEPHRRWDLRHGIEDFHYPGTWKLLGLLDAPPDVVHCHNLHGGYFDLRALPWLSRKAPVVITLHDAWLLSGHCSHSFECERWQSGR